jgi:hypothetical protein
MAGKCEDVVHCNSSNNQTGFLDGDELLDVLYRHHGGSLHGLPLLLHHHPPPPPAH